MIRKSTVRLINTDRYRWLNVGCILQKLQKFYENDSTFYKSDTNEYIPTRGFIETLVSLHKQELNMHVKLFINASETLKS